MVASPRRASHRPRDVLVADAVDAAAGIRIEIELAAGWRLTARVVNLFTAGRDDVQVDVAVAIPRERDLDVAGPDPGHGRRQGRVRSDRSRRVRDRKLQVELIERDLLREGQEYRGRGSARTASGFAVALDASAELAQEPEGTPTHEHVDGVEWRVPR